MFDSLDEKIKMDERESPQERIRRWAIILVVGAILLFAGLFLGFHYLQSS
jgi:hypothetical protein